MSERERCKAQVSDSVGWHHFQCSRYAVKDGYCKQHHPDAVAARQAESDRRAQERWVNDPINRMNRELTLLRAVAEAA